MTFIPNNDFLIEVAKGNVPKHSLVRIVGRNADVDTSLADLTMEDTIFTWPTVATTLEAISTSADDDSAGTGARVITVNGLDSSFNEISEDITMNGTTVTSATSASFVRVNSVVVKDAGTYGTTDEGSNVGDVAIRVSGDGATLAFISADPLGIGKNEDFKYTVPNAKTAVIIGAGVNVDGNKLAKILFILRENADTVAAPFSPKQLVAVLSEVQSRVDIPKENLNGFLDAKTDIWASSIAESVNTEVQMSMTILLIDD